MPRKKKYKFARELTSTPEEFAVALERASEEVASWPEWKRNIPVTAIPKRQQ